MKYIKSKKLFESSEVETIDDIVKDICIEFEDMGLTAHYIEEPKIVNYRDNGGFVVNIRNMKAHSSTHPDDADRKEPKEIILNDEIKDVIERLKDYLGNNLYYIKIYINSLWNNEYDSGWYDYQKFLNVKGVVAISIKINRQ